MDKPRNKLKKALTVIFSGIVFLFIASNVFLVTMDFSGGTDILWTYLPWIFIAWIAGFVLALGLFITAVYRNSVWLGLASILMLGGTGLFGFSTVANYSYAYERVSAAAREKVVLAMQEGNLQMDKLDGETLKRITPLLKTVKPSDLNDKYMGGTLKGRWEFEWAPDKDTRLRFVVFTPDISSRKPVWCYRQE